MGDLYSIVGAYKNKSGKLSLFGGYLAMVPNKDFFVGKIVDDFGASKIKGRLSDMELVFTQRYFGDEEIFEYEANYNTSRNVWEGLVTLPDRAVEEFSCCLIKNFAGLDFVDLSENTLLLGDQLYERLTTSDVEDLPAN